MTDEHRLIGQHRRGVRRSRGSAGARSARAEGLGARPRAGQALRRASGCSAIDVPEEYGGVDLDKVSVVVVAEHIAHSASFGATFGAQTGLVHHADPVFGTEAQKQKYLPRPRERRDRRRLALSESGSGSDALGARARATRQDDGSFVLNGEKMWITNGGFADVFIVFAKVDGEQFTAFIVERAFGGCRAATKSTRWACMAPRRRRSSCRTRRFRPRTARRDWQGSQGRVQRAELRPLQAGRDVPGRVQAGHRGVGAVRRDAQAVRAGRSHPSARSSTRSAR